MAHLEQQQSSSWVYKSKFLAKLNGACWHSPTHTAASESKLKYTVCQSAMQAAPGENEIL